MVRSAASTAKKLAPNEPPTPAPAPGERPMRRRLVAMGVLSGVLYAFAFPGYGVWPLALVAFVPALLVARRATVRQAVLVGAMAGLSSHLLAYYWIAHMLREFAGAPWPLAVLGFVALAAAQGASYGVGLGLARWLNRRTGWPYALCLAVGFTAMDFVYPLLFPSYIANSLFGATWLVQTADLWGVLGLTALVGAVNGTLVDVLAARRDRRPFPKRTVLATGALVLFAAGYGAVRTHQIDREVAAAPKLKVGLVQVNVGGFENTVGGRSVVERYLTLTRQLHDAGADLVVWPEGALRGVVSVGEDLRDGLLQGLKQPLVFGAARLGRDAHGMEEYNTAFLEDASGRVVSSYDKTDLLAFGEYIPGGDWFPQIYKMIPEASHFGRGTSTKPLVFGDWRLGTFICYEDILPRFVATIMQPTGGRRPDLMVNITNDSWYGHTVEPMEHLALASFRAIEHRRALVRSTNTGMSAFVDPAGRIVKRTHRSREETLMARVPKMSGTTVYEELGDFLGWGSLLVIAGVFVQSRRRRTS